ncbi:(4Fe-4S)-binding protein [Desulfovibrio psychrotolerans]|uniref:(4Fe-4S)-binding protein n=2 Tax=Desulfovibrio psychrotolerans TaxID=415242 RepID=A0A7J0BPU4_9BACT|nr:(4Fe-4S)-binding protein [Desulfovibrio psychrotolerans]
MRYGLAVPLLGILLLGAHTLRTGDVWLTSFVVTIFCLALTRQGWARLVTAAVLFGASLLWVRTGISLVHMRMMMGQDWLRLAAIMGGVSLFSLTGAGMLLSAPARARYMRHAATAVPQAAAFMVCALLLLVSRDQATRVTLLLSDRFFPGSGMLQIVLMSIYAAVVCGLLLDNRKARRVRAATWAFFSAVFFGQLALGLAGVERLLMTGTLHMPVPALVIAGPLFRGDGFFMLILFSVSVLLVGPAWCSHLCYIGAWDDRLSRVRKGAPAPLPAWAGTVRAGIAVTVFGTALGLRLAGASLGLALALAAAFGLAGVAVMMACSSRAGTMAHCSAFCPLGLAGNLLSAVSPWRLRINDRCTRCGACTRVCRYNALAPCQVEKGRPALSCSLCRDCTTVCAHGAMELTFFRASPAFSKRLFVVLVSSLHAVFLAVARI